MIDLGKLTKEQLIAELVTTRQRIKDLEQKPGANKGVKL